MNFQFNEHQQEVIKWAGNFAKRYLAEDAFNWTKWESRDFFWERSQILADAGFLGLNIPEEYGGGGLSILEACLVIEELAKTCPQTAYIVRNSTMGPVGFIAKLGSEEQKEKYVTPVVKGKKAVAICMTEPGAGTASSDMQTKAVKEGENYVINGNKVFISNANIADAFVVYCRFDKGEGASNIGAIIVDKHTPGVEVGPAMELIGGELFPVYFENVTVPSSQVLISGNQDKAAYKSLMSIYNAERLSNLFRFLGMGQIAFDMSCSYATERKQFGREIVEFQAIQLKLAEMALKLESARLLVYRAASNAENGLPSKKEVSLAKIATSEMLQYVTSEAMQIYGGYGLTKELPLEWIHRNTRSVRVAGGTDEIHRSMIAGELTKRKFDFRKHVAKAKN